MRLPLYLPHPPSSRFRDSALFSISPMRRRIIFDWGDKAIEGFMTHFLPPLRSAIRFAYSPSLPPSLSPSDLRRIYRVDPRAMAAPRIAIKCIFANLPFDVAIGVGTLTHGQGAPTLLHHQILKLTLIDFLCPCLGLFNAVSLPW